MKRIINLAILIVGLMVFQSFTTISNLHSSMLNSKQSNILLKKIVYVDFYFSVPSSGCSYHIVATINTDTGNGWGTMSQTCNGRSPRTLSFSITGANVTFALKGQITVIKDNLSDFVDVATGKDVDVDIPVKEGIADGITANGVFDN